MTRIGYLALIAVVLAACEPSGMGTRTDDPDILPATESYKEFGDYVLHFNALTTNQLDETVAAEYGIVRSNNRALLNVSILQNQNVGLATAVSGSVTASARNLTGQLRELPMQEVREGDAIYYIGETTIANAESLIFTVEAQIDSEPEPLTVSFQKQFFVDD